MINPKVSVIIPVYNVEEYLEECLDSVINQTLNEIEIICVNDGSTDNSLKILERYSHKDNRIKIITQKNCGLGCARNSGIKEAKGEYILFLDSDDYILKDTCEQLYENAYSNNSDAVIFKISRFNENSFNYSNPAFGLDNIFKDEDFLNFTFRYNDIKKYVLNASYSACLKLYKKSFLDSYNDFQFSVSTAYEDVLFHVKLMLRASRLSFSPNYFYCYRQTNLNSITHVSSNIFDIFNVIDSVESFLKENNFFDEFIIEFTQFKLAQILNYAISSISEKFFHCSKTVFNKMNIDNLRNLLPKYLIDQFDFVLNSNFNEFKLKFTPKGDKYPPFLSVIIPVFNDGKFISECLTSITSQTLKNIEILCVNDGSTDDSLEILNQWAKRDSRIKVFSKENGGSGSARNLALSYATGDYISFIDSDDTIVDNDSYFKLLSAAKKFDVDMVSTNIQLLTPNGIVDENNDITKITELKLKKPEEYGIPWFFTRNVLKRSFIKKNNLTFPNFKRGQDPVFLANVLSKIKKYVEVPIEFYQYNKMIPSNSLDTFIKNFDYVNSYYEVFKILLSQKKFYNVVCQFSEKLIGEMSNRTIPISTKKELIMFIKILDKIRDLFSKIDDEKLFNNVYFSLRDMILKLHLNNVKITCLKENNPHKSFFENISIIYCDLLDKDFEIDLTKHEEDMFFKSRICNSLKKENTVLRNRFLSLNNQNIFDIYESTDDFIYKNSLINELNNISDFFTVFYSNEILNNFEDSVILANIINTIEQYPIYNGAFYSNILHSKKIRLMNLFIEYFKHENKLLQQNIPELYDYSIDSCNYDELTFILIYREKNGDSERKKNVINVLNYLHDIGIKKILISEEDVRSRAQWIKDEFEDKFETFELVFTEGDHLFSRSSAINNGVKSSKTPYIFISDADVVLPKPVYDKSLSLISKYYDFVFPFDRKIMDITDKDEFMKDYNFDSVNNEIQYRVTADGGFLACKKESFLNSGAYNTNYKGWGGEDNEFILRLNKSDFKIVRLNNVLYHFYHDKEKSEKSNVDLLKRSFNLSYFGGIKLLINENKDIFYNFYRNRDFLDNNFNNIENNFKISIIMPINNIDTFLFERALNSLFNQTIGFENIELLLIDGSSSISSKRFAQKYVNEYSNIKYIYLDVESGEAISRNIGIKYASAEYILFLDYDCYLLEDACNSLYDLIEKNDADLIIANYIDLAVGFGENDMFKHVDEINNVISITGNKLYSKSFIIENDINFSSGELFMDCLFLSSSLSKSDNIILMEDAVLILPINNKFSSDDFNHFSYLFSLIKIYQNLNDNLEIKGNILNEFFSYLILFKLSRDDLRMFYKKLRELYSEDMDKIEINEKFLKLSNAIFNNDFLETFNIYRELIN